MKAKRTESNIMDKLPVTREQIEELIMAELQSFPGCECALEIRVVAVADHAMAASWTVSAFNPGRSDGDACDRALQEIVSRFQRVYDLVRLH